jgi:hypothetical protein
MVLEFLMISLNQILIDMHFIYFYEFLMGEIFELNLEFFVGGLDLEVLLREIHL